MGLKLQHKLATPPSPTCDWICEVAILMGLEMKLIRSQRNTQKPTWTATSTQLSSGHMISHNE